LKSHNRWSKGEFLRRKIDNNIVTFVGYPAVEVTSLEGGIACNNSSRIKAKIVSLVKLWSQLQRTANYADTTDGFLG
jgi:hypothetical protein